MVVLDRIAAKSSQLILSHIGTAARSGKLEGKDIERVATNALGVLQEQGLYAFFLYLLSSSGEETVESKMDRNELASCIIGARLLCLLNKQEIRCPGAGFTDGWVREADMVESGRVNEDKKKVLEFVSGQIASDLHRMIFVRDLFERVLIYARYGAKAMTSSTGEGSL
ncbi:MAG: hypothetical protein M1379_01735 [Firmicutes bacterium]|nr:hypothetical protein [Bacillota bacterium]